MVRHLRFKLIVTSLIACFCLSIFLLVNHHFDSPAMNPCPQSLIQPRVPSEEEVKYIDNHKLAVIVPFRSRFNQLLRLVPHLDNFLKGQGINFKILIMNQIDDLRFNRASLINTGFMMSQLIDADYIAMHDVDLLPLNPNLSYRWPGIGNLFHVSSPQYHPKYHYETFVGGILLVTAVDFGSVDGMSNRYYGWGLEDDEFYARIKAKGLKITRPSGLSTGINDTFSHIHDKSDKRDMAKLFNQMDVTRKRDRETGLSDLKYKLRSQRELSIDGHTCTIYDIELVCDVSKTPWCKSEVKSGGKKNTQVIKRRNKSLEANEIHHSINRPEDL